MISKLFIFETDSLDPYHNIAMEEYLLDTLPYDSALLYLWRNERTVVIGRNQSSENEVNIQALEAEGGHLARRLSGGGAVYHDIGNLNTAVECSGMDDLLIWNGYGVHLSHVGNASLLSSGRVLQLKKYFACA